MPFLIFGLMSFMLSSCAYILAESAGDKRYAELRRELAHARQSFAAGHYGAAAAQYEAAAREEDIYISPKTGNVSSVHKVKLAGAEYREAMDGVCSSYQHAQRWPEASRACQSALTVSGSTSGLILPEVERELRRQYGQKIRRALQNEDLAAAKEHLTKYRVIRGANAKNIATWEQQIPVLEKEIQRRTAENDKAKARERQQQIEAARQQLATKHADTQGFTAEGFRWWLLAHRTVLGSRFFSDVEVGETLLTLWVTDPNQLGHVQNISAFANIADAFVVWCHCDGETRVGVDMSHFGSGKMIALRYRLNLETARSQLQ